jgi:hypothetical protein
MYIYTKYIYAIVVIVTINHARTVCGPRQKNERRRRKKKVGHSENI